jgi:hypothetical protein
MIGTLLFLILLALIFPALVRGAFILSAYVLAGALCLVFIGLIAAMMGY